MAASVRLTRPIQIICTANLKTWVSIVSLILQVGDPLTQLTRLQMAWRISAPMERVTTLLRLFSTRITREPCWLEASVFGVVGTLRPPRCLRGSPLKDRYPTGAHHPHPFRSARSSSIQARRI